VTSLLESYTAGRWFRATDEGRPVRDAVTGDEIARISATGLDLAAMVAHARTVGVSALAPLTFHERAALLK
jgi:oxepin-CoA hydrolase/3-oxo-5,6-dehydrosuberyl-CoA semialdehyde dehydrogenase